MCVHLRLFFVSPLISKTTSPAPLPLRKCIFVCLPFDFFVDSNHTHSLKETAYFHTTHCSVLFCSVLSTHLNLFDLLCGVPTGPLSYQVILRPISSSSKSFAGFGGSGSSHGQSAVVARCYLIGCHLIEFWISAYYWELLIMEGLWGAMFWSALLWSIGDAIAQRLENRNKSSAKYGSSGGGAWSYDYKRTLRLAMYVSVWEVRRMRLTKCDSEAALFCCCVLASMYIPVYRFAAFYFAPLTILWFAFLERTFPGDGVVVALKRLSLDQTINAVVSNVSLFVVVGLMEGKNLNEIKTKLRNELWDTLKVGWIVWPVVQFVNFGFVPLEYRIVVANCVNIPWCAYLAMRVAAAAPSPGSSGSVGAGGSGSSTPKKSLSAVTGSDDSGNGGGGGGGGDDPSVVVDIHTASGGAGGGEASTAPLTGGSARD